MKTPAYQYAGLQHVRRRRLGVEECARRLHRLAYAESRLMFMQAAHIISTPERDVKALLSRAQYEDGQHADRLKQRLVELRVSRQRAFEEPCPSLRVVFDEALHSRGTVELVAALARVIKPAMLESYRRYAAATNGLADYGTVRALREVMAEEEEEARLLEAADADIVSSAQQQATADAWVRHLQDLVAAAGGIDGAGDAADEERLVRRRSTQPYTIPREQAWDDTFPRVWDVEHVDDEQVSERLAQMICTRLGELTIAEALSFVLCETVGQPWPFYVDISRHMWDEMRHSLFGEAATEEICGDRSGLPLREWETEYLYAMDPLALYSMLGDVEASLMKYPPGKRFEYEFCRDQAGHPLMALLQDFDWADEVLHVNITRRQLREWFTGSEEALLALAREGNERRDAARAAHPPTPLPDISHVLGGEDRT